MAGRVESLLIETGNIKSKSALISENSTQKGQRSESLRFMNNAIRDSFVVLQPLAYT